MLTHEYTSDNIYMYNYCLHHSALTPLQLSAMSPAEIKAEYNKLQPQVYTKNHTVNHNWVEKGDTNVN